MAYSHKRARRSSGRATEKKKAATAAPQQESGSLAQLRAMTEHTDFLESRKKDYVPKPRAVRRYEKYASMGGDGQQG